MFTLERASVRLKARHERAEAEAHVGAREDGEQQARVFGLVLLGQVQVAADRVAEVHLPVPQQLHCTRIAHSHSSSRTAYWYTRHYCNAEHEYEYRSRPGGRAAAGRCSSTCGSPL